MRGLGIVVALTAIATLGAGARVAGRVQSATGFRADWNDLETWSRLLDVSRETEVGVGLQPAGPGGVMLVAFSARLDTRAPATPPREVVVQVAAPSRANPNVQRTPTLALSLDDRTDKRLTITLTPRLVVDNPAPGAEIHDGTARLRLTEFTRILEAETMKASIFGFDVEFRPDQLKAIRAFADRVHLLPR